MTALRLDGSTGRASSPDFRRPAMRGWGGGAAMSALLLVLTAIGVFHVWSRTRVVAVGYALGELQREHVALTAEHDRLRIEVETLRSPAVLERVARTRLGMAPPAPGAVSAAGPRFAEAGEGGRGMDGLRHSPGPAEPSRLDVRRAAARSAAPPLVLARRAPSPGR